MAQKISQGNIFGRLGGGVAKGMADTIPKEIERGRLSQGLRSFADNYGKQNLSPLQTAAYINSIPGAAENPQLVKSFTDLALQDREMNAFKGGGPRDPQGAYGGQQGQAPPYPQDNTTPAVEPMAQPGVRKDLDAAQRREMVSPDRGNVPQDQPIPKDRGIVEANPLDQRAIPRQPWSPEKRNSRVGEYYDMGFTRETALQLAQDDEARDLKEPEVFQKQQSDLKVIQDEARKALDEDLKNKLQTDEKGKFKDMAGEMYVNLRRGMESDLRMNPDASLSNVVDKWSKNALDLAKTKTQLDKTLSGIGPSDIFKGDDALNKLKAYQKIYAETGNQEMYFNRLKEAGLSPLSSSIISYPTSKPANYFINAYKKIPTKASRHAQIAEMPPTYKEVQQHARKTALDLDNHIERDDSILAIAQELSLKDPYFDKNVFFNEIQENMENMRLTDRQKREVAEGKEGIMPYWMDFLVMPWFRRAR